MKRIILTFALLLSVLSVSAIDINPIITAFKSGNTSPISSSMDEEVELSIPGTTKKGNGSDAISALNTFFSSNKPSGFTILHHADKKDSGFLVGKLACVSGEYRVNITYRTDGDKAIIQSIRIE